MKNCFIALTELVQNISDYNKNAKTIKNNTELNLKVCSSHLTLTSRNLIRKDHLANIRSIYKDLFSLSMNELDIKYREAMLNKKSLGLLMVRKLKDSSFAWCIEDHTCEKQLFWLKTELKYFYGTTAY